MEDGKKEDESYSIMSISCYILLTIFSIYMLYVLFLEDSDKYWKNEAIKNIKGGEAPF